MRFLFAACAALFVVGCGSDKFASSDAGGDGGGGSDAGGDGAATDSGQPADGGGTDSGPTKTWCDLNHVGTTIFCADFDKSANLVAGWTNNTKNGNNVLGVLDTQVFKSAPAACHVQTPNAFQNSVFTLDYDTTQATTQVELLFEANVQNTTTGIATFASLVWGDVDVRVQTTFGNPGNLLLLVRANGMADNPVATNTAVPTGWHRYRVSLAINSNIALFLDGNSIATTPLPAGSVQANGKKTIRIGVDTPAMTPAASVFYDNVLFNVN